MPKAQSGITPQNKPSVLSSSCLPPRRSSHPEHAPAGKDGSPRKRERESALGVKHQLSTEVEITHRGMWCAPAGAATPIWQEGSVEDFPKPYLHSGTLINCSRAAAMARLSSHCPAPHAWDTVPAQSWSQSRSHACPQDSCAV